MIRSVSPLPSWVMRRVEERREADESGALKPTTPKAFRFFMEQHVENVIKQHCERQRRYVQLEQEMASAKFQVPTSLQLFATALHSITTRDKGVARICFRGVGLVKIQKS